MSFYHESDVSLGSAAKLDLTAIMRQVYLWMFVALLATAGTAFFIGTQTNLTQALYGNPLLFIGAFIVEIGLVMFISARIMQLDPATATALFLVYAVLNGVTLSFIFLAYNLGTIAYASVASAAMFGAMSIVGYTTKIDLSRMGGILVMALIGLIVATIINVFLASSTLFWIINYVGVLIFVGLTAYDTQRIRNMALNVSVNSSGDQLSLVRRISVIGALTLYLDFINLFLFTLRIMGGRGGGRR